MSLSWTSLRAWGGSQQTAFEELCCQLARSEKPPNARFIRKGSPDAGVECFATLPNGDEWGWQAKFFETSLTATQWNQVDRSVKKALDSHPKLTRYYVCVPRDRSDGRKPSTKTEMQKWHERVAKWQGWAADRGMDVEYVWWGTSELWERLSLPEQAGRLDFWFGDPKLFVESWFRGRLDEAIASAGARYTPELHVELPIAQTLELFGRTGAAGESVQRLADDIRRSCTYEIRRIPTEDPSSGELSLKSLTDECDEVMCALADFDCPPDQPWRVSNVCEAIQRTLDLAEDHHQPLTSAERSYDEANPVDEDSYAPRSNPFREAGFALRRLEGQLWRTQDELRHREPVVNADLLIVTGDAGTGKTHLLCDVGADRIARGLPTVVLMGQRFLSKADPWTQVLEQLDRVSSSADAFVGALEAAAQAAACRALVIIDGINEGEGDAIWPAHLAPFLARLRRSPWIGIVLSVRTTYLERVVNQEVLQDAHVLEHHGFADSTYAAVRRFCEHFELEFPTTPLLRPEFDNPLFLKALCEGLRRVGQRRFPVGAEGITKVFDRYLEGVNAEIADLLDHDRYSATVQRALYGFASELASRREYWLPRGEAQLLVNELAPASGYSRTLYRALVDSGLLIEVPTGGQDSEIAVQFGFEWFADHLIARHFVNSHKTPESLAEALDIESSDGIAFALGWRPGLQDALTVLVPECHGVELLDLYWDDVYGPSIVEAFFRTLPWRDPDTIGPRCIELVEAAFESVEDYERRQLLDALVTCATIPGHPFGAESLDDRWRRIPMADRDADWSTHLHYAYGQDGPVDRLLDWAEGLHASDTAADPESVWACAVVLAWFLATPNRFVRDRATKCLVALLDGNFDLAAQLVHHFRHVDDPYVRERVMAAAYGIAMRSTDVQGVASLAETTYREVFADGEPPAHFLLRDYARGVIERALYLGAEIDVDRSKIEPPHQSDWPHIPDDAELEELDRDETDPSEPMSDMERVRGQIRFSVMHWDFARYTIGTNSSTESRSWLSVPLEDPRWRSCDEELEDFLGSLEGDLREIFERLIERNRPRPPTIRFAADDPSSSQGESGEPGFAFATRRWIAELGLEQVVVQLLNGEQRAQYDELMALRDRIEPRLGLDIIQRYVLWRAFDLGWTVERFGGFDSRVASLTRHDTKKPERMGKKYQWIALHEILAHISDNFQYRASYSDTRPFAEYNGPWQGYRRDIDPSFIQPAIRNHRPRSTASREWWTSLDDFDWAEDTDALDWLDRANELPDVLGLLRPKSNEDGTAWLRLDGSWTWRQPTPPGHDQWDRPRREVWVNLTGYLVDRESAAETLEALRATNSREARLPEPRNPWVLFFGEVGWSPGFRDVVILPEAEGLFVDESQPPHIQSLRPAAMSYVGGDGSYDCSTSEPVSLCRPDWRIVESMGLTWTGKNADFNNVAGELVAFDPTGRGSETPALLMRESDFAQFLEESETVLIWSVTGERMALRSSHGKWDGALKFSGVYEYTPEDPIGNLKTQLWRPGDVV